MPDAGRKSRLYHFAGWLVLVLLVVALDQWSKYALVARLEYGDHLPLTGFFNLAHAHNQGAAFGMLNQAGGWQRWLFTLLALGVSGWILRELYLHGNRKLISAALSLVMGGAIGNLIDRLNYGYVVDFLDFYWGTSHFPAFNLADSAITGGAALLLIEALIDFRRTRATS